jgi:hypothetical protein
MALTCKSQEFTKSPGRSWFITERITVFTDFSFEKLRSADADVTGTVRRVTIGMGVREGKN